MTEAVLNPGIPRGMPSFKRVDWRRIYHDFKASGLTLTEYRRARLPSMLEAPGDGMPFPCEQTLRRHFEPFKIREAMEANADMPDGLSPAARFACSRWVTTYQDWKQSGQSKTEYYRRHREVQEHSLYTFYVKTRRAATILSTMVSPSSVNPDDCSPDRPVTVVRLPELSPPGGRPPACRTGFPGRESAESRPGPGLVRVETVTGGMRLSFVSPDPEQSVVRILQAMGGSGHAA